MANPLESLSTKTIPAKYSYFQNLNIGLDILLIAGWAAASVLYSFFIARKRGPVLLLATYAGLAVADVVTKLNLAPTGALKNLQESENFALLVFLITALLAFVALIRTIRSHIRLPGSKTGLLIMGALEMGAFISSVGGLIPADMQKQILGFAGLLFITPWTHALWLILPLLVFLIGEYRERAMLENL